MPLITFTKPSPSDPPASRYLRGARPSPCCRAAAGLLLLGRQHQVQPDTVALLQHRPERPAAAYPQLQSLVRCCGYALLSWPLLPQAQHHGARSAAAGPTAADARQDGQVLPRRCPGLQQQHLHPRHLLLQRLLQRLLLSIQRRQRGAASGLGA
jgi:hypothetical protein